MRLRIGLIALSLSIAGAAAAQANPVTTLWVNNATFGAPLLQEYDLGTGALIDQITAPHGDNGRGIVQVGDIVYYTSANTNAVYGYNFVNNTDLGTIFTVSGATGLSTMAYDGHNFWIGDYSGTNQAYLYTPTGTLLKTISLANCTGHCDGLEYVNGNLISNRADEPQPAIYDVYDTNGNLLTPALINDPNHGTGIAWDGTNFYVDQGGDYGNGTIAVYDANGALVRTITLTGYTYYDGEDLSVNYAAVIPTPEPAAIGLLGVGLVGLFVARRRARKQ